MEPISVRFGRPEGVRSRESIFDRFFVEICSIFDRCCIDRCPRNWLVLDAVVRSTRPKIRCGAHRANPRKCAFPHGKTRKIDVPGFLCKLTRRWSTSQKGCRKGKERCSKNRQKGSSFEVRVRSKIRSIWGSKIDQKSIQNRSIWASELHRRTVFAQKCLRDSF